MADVSVPQRSGEIRISINGDPEIVLEVSNGRVEADGNVLAALLADVAGSKVVQPKSEAKAEAKAS